MGWIGSHLFDDYTCPSGHIGLGLGCHIYVDDATCPSGHIELGLGCHIYIDTTTQVIRGKLKCKTTEVINDLVKCEQLTMVQRIYVWIGLDRICLTTPHVLQGILDWG